MKDLKLISWICTAVHTVVDFFLAVCSLTLRRSLKVRFKKETNTDFCCPIRKGIIFQGLWPSFCHFNSSCQIWSDYCEAHAICCRYVFMYVFLSESAVICVKQQHWFFGPLIIQYCKHFTLNWLDNLLIPKLFKTDLLDLSDVERVSHKTHKLLWL